MANEINIVYETENCSSASTPMRINLGASLNVVFTPSSGCTIYGADIQVKEGTVDKTTSVVTAANETVTISMTNVRSNVYIKCKCPYKQCDCYIIYAGEILSNTSQKLGFSIKHGDTLLTTMEEESEIQLTTKGTVLTSPITIGTIVINPNSEKIYMKDDIIVSTYDALEPPEIYISANTLHIVSVLHALRYKIYVDGVFSTATTATQFDLTTIVSDRNTHQIFVKAVGPSGDSEPSQTISYRRIDTAKLSDYASSTIGSMGDRSMLSLHTI